MLIVFDCDGTLIDSEPIACRVLSEMMAEMDVHLSSDEIMRNFIGYNRSDAAARLEPHYGGPVPDSFFDAFRQRLDAVLKDELRPVPGVVEMLGDLSQPRCVASSSSHATIRHGLKLTGLTAFFADAIFSGAEDVQRGKPEPDLFLHAATSMRFEPSECIVVEDSVPGVQAACRAGMRVFGFARHTDAGRLRDAGAEVFTEMGELSALFQSLPGG